MCKMSKMRILKSTPEDAESLNDLVHSCYRSEESLKGWTTEATYIVGNRTNPSRIRKEISTPGIAILKGLNDQGQIISCVLVEQNFVTNKLNVGLLCVRPELQGSGIGRQMMDAVVDYAKTLTPPITSLVIHVITIRDSLIAWYERLGFVKTGHKEPFPDASADVGVPIDNKNLEFFILEKPLLYPFVIPH